MFSIIGKGFTLVSQIVIAWFLIPEEMGLAAMAMSVSAITILIASGHLKTILVQKQENFYEDIVDIYWLSVLTGVIVSVVYIIAAPIFSHIYQEPVVKNLIFILAAGPVLNSIAVMYNAVLINELKFKAVAGIELTEAFIANFSMVIFAILGFGAYSLVLPHILKGIVSIALQRKYAGSIRFKYPDFSKWIGYLTPSIWLGIQSVSEALIRHGSSFILGVVKGAEITGLYFWGYSIAAQAVYLLSDKLHNILFPTFTKIKDSTHRQTEAYIITSKSLLLLIIPVIIFQILLAEDLIGLFFHERWMPAAMVISWLSIGLLTQPFKILMFSILKANGEFRFLSIITIISSLIILFFTYFGATIGNHVTVAKYVGISMFFLGILYIGITFKLLNNSVKKVIFNFYDIFFLFVTMFLLSVQIIQIIDFESVVANLLTNIALISIIYLIVTFFTFKKLVNLVFKKLFGDVA